MKKRNFLGAVQWKLFMFMLLGFFASSCGDDDDEAVVVQPTGAIVVADQFLPENDDMVMIESVTLNQNGWVVLHEDNNGAPGAVIGVSDLVNAGTTEDLMVEFNEDFTPMLGEVYWAMLHVDKGQAGVFEFTGANSPDVPVVEANGTPVAVWFQNTFPAGAVGQTVVMEGQNGFEVAGNGLIYDGLNDVAWVVLVMDGTTPGVMHPAHIHSDVDGAIVYPLNPVDGDTGLSVTRFDAVTFEELQGFDGYINVHLSPDDLTVVSQGNTDAD